MRRYHEKQLEIEYTKGRYFDRFFQILDETEPLDQNILRYSFIDWHLLSNLNAIKRKNEETKDRKKKLKAEMKSREETTFIVLNK